MILQFDNEMEVEFSKGLIDNKTIDIIIIPAKNRQNNEDFDSDSINLTWVLHEFFGQFLTINITFE
jgi:hypothetical protein